jgi:hypothetical protein
MSWLPSLSVLWQAITQSLTGDAQIPDRLYIGVGFELFLPILVIGVILALVALIKEGAVYAQDIIIALVLIGLVITVLWPLVIIILEVVVGCLLAYGAWLCLGLTLRSLERLIKGPSRH